MSPRIRKLCLLLLTPLVLSGCRSSDTPSTASATPTATFAAASASTQAEPVSASAKLEVGPDKGGREQMRARDGDYKFQVTYEVGVTPSRGGEEGRYDLEFSKWMPTKGGRGSSERIALPLGDGKSVEALRNLLREEPSFRPLGLTVGEALLSERYPQWPLKAEDKKNLEAFLAVLKD